MLYIYNFLKVKLCYRTYWKQGLALLTICLLVFARSCVDGDSDDNQSSNTLTDINGNIYETITLGNQCWTVDDARVTSYNDGTEIPVYNNVNDDSWISTIGAVIYQPEATLWDSMYYNWYAANGIHDNDDSTANKSIAPDGWKVPTIEDWQELVDYLIENGYNYDGTFEGNKVGKSLASTEVWNNAPFEGQVGNQRELNNSTGFNGFPFGGVQVIGGFDGAGSWTIYWSNSSGNSELGNSAFLHMNGESLDIYQNFNEKNGYKIRFMKSEQCN